MKKIISMFIFLILLVGCSLSNTPTAQAEDLLSKYQMLDNDIKAGINDVVMGESLTQEQQERYRKIIEKQYKNLMYEIKDEDDRSTDILFDFIVCHHITSIFHRRNRLFQDHFPKQYNRDCDHSKYQTDGRRIPVKGVHRRCRARQLPL